MGAISFLPGRSAFNSRSLGERLTAHCNKDRREERDSLMPKHSLPIPQRDNYRIVAARKCAIGKLEVFDHYNNT